MIRRAATTILLATLTACGGDDDGGGSADAAPGGDDGGAADASPPADVTLRTYDGPLPSDIELVAYQDGDGAWQAVDGGGGIYTFTVESGRYSVMTVCEINGFANVRTVRLLASDSTALAVQCPWHPRTGDFSGEVTGLEDGDTVSIQLGTTVAGAFFNTPTYTASVFPGRADVSAVRYDSTLAPQRVIIDRGVLVQDGDQYDFDLGSGGFVPVVLSVEVTGLLDGEDQEDTYLTTAFYTARGPATYLGQGVGPTEWFGVPAAEVEEDEVHLLDVEGGSRAEGTYRQAYAFLHEADDVSLALPAPAEDPTVTVAETSPYVRLRYEPARAAGHRLYELRFRQNGGPSAEWKDLASSGWLDAGHAIETADLSDVDGWNPDWTLQSGMTLSMSALGYGGDATVAQILDGLALFDMPVGYWGAQVTGLDGARFTRTWWDSEILP